MKIILNAELEQLINTQLARGNYDSVDDLLKDALLTLAEKVKTPKKDHNFSKDTLAIETNQQLDKLAGTWNEADEQEFLENTQVFREIEEDLYKKGHFFCLWLPPVL